MSIFLTGATGFLGCAVLARLAEDGRSVVTFGRNRPLSSASFDFVQGDLASGEGLDRIPWEEIDAVIHLAASGVKASHRKWPDCLAVNVLGTQRLLHGIQSHATRRPTVFAARTFYEHACEKWSALKDNPYIATKAAGSELVRLWSGSYAGAVVFGTVFQIYGPGDDAGNVLSYAAAKLKARERSEFGSGSGLRDWLAIDDAARAICAAATISAPGLHEFDIGSGELVSIREMILTLAEIAGAPEGLMDFDPARDRPDGGVAMRASRFVPGWKPQVSRERGLAQLIQNL